MPPPKKKKQTTSGLQVICAGLYPEEQAIVTRTMSKYGMNLSTAVRYLIRNGGIALDNDAN